MHTIFNPLRYFFTYCLLFVTTVVNAYNLRQLTSENGLSNSAVQAICQDYEGYMWFGTCDGLNMYNGHNLTVYKPTNGSNTLSGNLIESILEAEDGIFWIQTNYGLNRFDKKERKMDYFRDFNGKNHIVKDQRNNIAIFQDSSLYFYQPKRKTFKEIQINLSYDDVLNVTTDMSNNVWIFARNGKSLTYKVSRNQQEDVSVLPVSQFFHDKDLLYCYNDDNAIVYFIDASGAFYEYNLTNNQKKTIWNLAKEIHERGPVSSIIKHHNDYLIGFETNGLLRVIETNKLNHFEVMEMDIKSGVFCLSKDRKQDIIWVGTDGQGVFIYSTGTYSIKSHILNSLDHQISKPVRALLLDDHNTLWIGTKGDGILTISNFQYNRSLDTQTKTHLSNTNSLLGNNSVYTFAKSKRNLLWIGHDQGLNYYSYKEKRIKQIKINTTNQDLKYIHSIKEVNDSTLWLASVGDGMVRVTLTWTADEPTIKTIKKIKVHGGDLAHNYFFTLYYENDSTLWFGNRGYGAFKLNTARERYVTMIFDRGHNFQTMNDIFSITKDHNHNYWFGTSFGLIKFNNGIEKVFNEQNGFPNNTIHGILKDSKKYLWLSTNQGIIRFDTDEETYQVYNHYNGLEVTEFSDGAIYKDESTGNLLFGGINGFVTVTKNQKFGTDNYMPEILLSNLTIFGKDHNIYEFLNQDRSGRILRLNHSQNFFSIKFTAIDYLNGNNYSYLYKLEGLHDNWIENGPNGNISFTNIPPGHYKLHIKYKNLVTKIESPEQLLEIAIRPPWYRTQMAYTSYFIIYVLLILVVFRTSKRWYKLKRDAAIAKLNEQKKEEVYESKLRFFTNITHELCTPLTLINGPCEKILSHTADGFIQKYATIIQRNADKLNTLIQELIEFRRIETGNKPLEVQPVPLTEITRNMAETFSDIAETKSIDYKILLDTVPSWNTDLNCYSKIVNNLLSNAFKYTPDGGEITLKLTYSAEQTEVVVSNTGKGIKAEDIPGIFDRYKILDDLEKTRKKGNFSRNGLGLAICSSLTKLLNGDILVTSIPNEITHFKVILPSLTPNASAQASLPKIDVNPDFHTPITTKTFQKPIDKTKPKLMIVEDDSEMLWFISEIFTEKYNILPAENPKEALVLLHQHQPDLIISDVMMPEMDGINFAKTIKEDVNTQHIPLILLSAKNTPEDQVLGIDSGAELYLTKPFNVNYLEKVVDRFLKREEDLKDYYNSVRSSFVLEEGRFVHKEDKAFYDSILNIIHENISDPKLNSEYISNKLGMSNRSLYRKFKDITDQSLTELIKEFRFDLVEKLLISTNLSIDEIIFKTGFSNRGNFFRLFARKYGCTPKSFREQRKNEFEQGVNPHGEVE